MIANIIILKLSVKSILVTKHVEIWFAAKKSCLAMRRYLKTQRQYHNFRSHNNFDASNYYFSNS